jgi:hypothetical protein
MAPANQTKFWSAKDSGSVAESSASQNQVSESDVISQPDKISLPQQVVLILKRHANEAVLINAFRVCLLDDLAIFRDSLSGSSTPTKG